MKNDKPHGLGTFLYDNGDYYKGTYSNGIRHGVGVSFWKKTMLKQERRYTSGKLTFRSKLKGKNRVRS